jgi:hypothetical protein
MPTPKQLPPGPGMCCAYMTVIVIGLAGIGLSVLLMWYFGSD